MGNLFMGNFSFHSELQNLWANPKFHESWQILILIQVAKLMGKSNPIVSCKTNRMQSGASVTWSICKVLTSSLNYRRNLTRDSSREDQALSKEAIWADVSQSILSTATYNLRIVLGQLSIYGGKYGDKEVPNGSIHRPLFKVIVSNLY